MTVVVVVGLFVVPFVVLMTSAAKQRPRALLVTVSLVILVAHWLGMVWLVMPSLYPEGVAFRFLWIDLGALLLIGGVAGWWVLRQARGRALVPVHDPRLLEALGRGTAGGHGADGSHAPAVERDAASGPDLSGATHG